jgi:hypothetical protein
MSGNTESLERRMPDRAVVSDFGLLVEHGLSASGRKATEFISIDSREVFTGASKRVA